MNKFLELLSNRTLWCSLTAWFISQFIKYIISGYRTRSWSLRNFWGSGGMPSAHTASVISLTMNAGLKNGFSSTLFAACTIFSIIVMYDAMGVRRETGKQGSVINMLLNITAPDEEVDMKERIGHTPLEVAAGTAVGIVCALLFAALP